MTRSRVRWLLFVLLAGLAGGATLFCATRGGRGDGSVETAAPPPPPPPTTEVLPSPPPETAAPDFPDFPTAARPPLDILPGSEGEPSIAGSSGAENIYILDDPTIAAPEPGTPTTAAVTTAVELIRAVTYLRYPRTMWRGRTEEVTAQVAPENLREMLEAQTPRGQQSARWDVRVTRYLRAELTGPGFAIEALPPVEQELAADTPVEWKWNVTPKRKGTEPLTLRIIRIVKGADGKERPTTLPSYAFTVDVRVNWIGAARDGVLGFLRESWTDVWKVLLVPAFVAMWAWWRKKHPRPVPKAP